MNSPFVTTRERETGPGPPETVSSVDLAAARISIPTSCEGEK